MTLVQRMALSFAFIVGIFITVAVFASLSVSQIINRHDYIIEYPIARSMALVEFHQEFSEMRREVRDTVFSNTWMLDSTQQDLYEVYLRVYNLYTSIHYTAGSYLLNILNDPFLSSYYIFAEYNDMVDALERVSVMFNMLYTDIFSQTIYGRDYAFASYEINQIALNVDSTISYLRNRAIHTQNLGREELNANARFTNVLVIGAIISSVFMVIWLSVAMYNGLKRGVNQLENTAKNVQEESYEMMHAIINTMPMMVTFWDEDLNFLDANEEAVRFFKVSTKEELIERFYEFHPEKQPDGRFSVEASIAIGRQALKTGQIITEWVHKDAEGNLIPVKTIKKRVKYKGVNALAAYALDITDLKAAAKRERDFLQKAEAADENSQAKSRFLARMSHEIRTPITAVLGISEIQLHNGNLPMNVEEAFNKIHHSSQILLDLIDDILDMSKIEAGKIRIISEKYETTSLINDVVQLNMYRLGSKKLEFTIDIQEGISTYLIGDALRIKQILNNLLSNAFKYTDSGFVKLIMSYEKPKPESDKILLIFTIEDSGQGMSEKSLKYIFDEYERFSEDINRNIQGAGLGAAIVYSLVSLMNGTISVESTLDVGTKFTVRLPQNTDGMEILNPEIIQRLQNFNFINDKKMNFTPESMPYGKVLVVDDIDTNLYVARGMLNFYNLTVECCESGMEAIGLIKAGYEYDVIFMDHMMPGMDGIEATAIIRSEGYTKPIVALTANAIIGQAEMFMNSGFDGFVSKPINAKLLNSALEKFVRDVQPEEIIEAARKSEKPLDFHTKDREFTKEIKRQFAQGQKNAPEKMKEALENKDHETVRRLAHTLKGLAFTIGAERLGIVSSEVERLAKNGEETLSAIEKLEVEHISVLSKIDVETVKIDKIGLKSTFDTLEQLLIDSDPTCLSHVNDLRNIREASVLIKCIENLQYEEALVFLSPLREILEV